jgi:hypothetical protein
LKIKTRTPTVLPTKPTSSISKQVAIGSGPYLKPSLYGKGGATAEQPLESKAEAPKKKWLQTRKERKGALGRGQKTRSGAFKRSDR